MTFRTRWNALTVSTVTLARWVAGSPLPLRLAPVMMMAWLLAMWRLGASDLWLDEAISYWISKKPLLELLQYSMQQSREHPPLYYAVLHLWMRLIGESEFSLRAFSASGGLTAVALVAALARRWFSDRAAVVSALVMATAPLATLHARDARMYSWLVALTALNVYALDNGLFRHRRRDWALFFGSLLLMLGTHYFSGLLLISYAAYLALRWRRLPSSGRTRLALLLSGLVTLGVIWILSQPGPRGSLLETGAFALRASRSWPNLGNLFAQWALGAIVFTLPRSTAWLLAFPIWLLALLGIVTAGRSHRRQRDGLPWLLALMILVPILVAFTILPAIQGRHVMAAFGLFALAVALGIQRIGQRVRLLGAAALIAVLGLNLTLTMRHILPVQQPFSTPLRYVSDRARDDEPVAYTYFFDWPQDYYYNRRGLPVRLLLTTDAAITEGEAETVATAALANAPSLWLMLYPGPENTDRLEQAFNRLAYPTGRVWFTGDRGVVHYFSPMPMQERTGALGWENGISLKRWSTSGDSVAAGDAIRLEFEWRTAEAVAEEALLVLRLVGSDRAVWHEQVMTPCNGRCPTDKWTSASVMDHLAFYVPPDVPPGTYELRIGWINPKGVPSLGQSETDTVKRADLPLLPVDVALPMQTAQAAPAPPLSRSLEGVVRPGLTLTSADFAEPIVQGGAALVVPLQFTVSAAQPQLEAHLLVQGQGQRFVLRAPLGQAWHSSETWTPGRAIRVQPQFQVPGAIRPGRYHVSLGVFATGASEAETLVRIGELRVEDRPRRFDVPEIGIAADASCDEGVRLVRFALQISATPGSQVPLTLVWQAGGPTSRNWKVFAHLLDAEGVMRGQADAYPMAGVALTPSWRPGEVIVDEHSFDLPAEFAAGAYHVWVGFYDEPTGERLRCGEGDSITLPVVLEVSSR